VTEPLNDAPDDQLADALSQVFAAVDPVPDHVSAAARAAFTWRTIDAELAEFAFDSADQPLGVRGGDVNRQVTFRSPSVEIELMITEADARHLVGQLIPPDVVGIELVSGDARATVDSDHLGRFTFDQLPSGPARLVVRGADGVVLAQTDWLLL